MVLNTVKLMLTDGAVGGWLGAAALQLGVGAGGADRRGGGAKRNPPAQLSRTGGLWEGFEA
jgi:hypothetical protein